MTKQLMTLVLVFLILFSNCNERVSEKHNVIVDTAQSQNVVDFLLEKEIEIQNFSYPAIRAVDGNIWVYGSSTNQNDIAINVYDKNFDLRETKALKYGQGPGDVGILPLIFDGGEEIFVSDHSQYRVTIFDKDLNFMRMVRTPKNLVCIAVDDEFQHILFRKYDRSRDGLKFTDNYFIATFPEQKVSKYHSIGPFPRLFMRGGRSYIILSEDQYFHYFIHNASIYFLDASKYEILKFDLYGNPQKHVAAEFNSLPMPDDPRILDSWSLEHNGHSRRKMYLLGDKIVPATFMMKLKNGFVVIRRTGWSIGCEGLVESDYFDYNLEFKGKAAVPCFYRIFHRRDVFFPYSYQYYDGHLYLIQERDDHFVLQKWSVQEKADET